MGRKMMFAPVLFITGPTASGKSDLAVALARQSGAEVVAMDAFQVYRGLDIGTDKPSKKIQAEIPHHLLDLVEPVQPFSVADYLRHAQAVREDLLARNRPSIWVGGTGFYFRALRQGLSSAPASDPTVIKALEQRSTQDLAEEIKRLDPAWAAQADLKNRRRIIRALAVVQQTGQPLSFWQQQRSSPVVSESKAVCLVLEISALREKINRRVHTMWENGWPEEVARLRRLASWEASQSAAAIGYRAILSYLDGELDKEACLRQIALETGQFAKRQLTWFRAEPNILRVPADDAEKLRAKVLPLL
ncbi:MAG: tRNA (adenosine(37)-N6)-dimethylallyltransferase MiaA [bacterium]